MEAYDAAGKIRSNILTIQLANNKRFSLPVVSNTVIRQTTISGMPQLQSYLRKQCEIEFARGFTSSMFSFALGRKISYRENEALSSISEHFQTNDHRMSELIKAIVTHPTFRHPNRVASSSTAADLSQATRGK